MLKAVLFDLDGTLLPMDLDVFLAAFLKDVTQRTTALGLDAQAVIRAVGEGTEAVIRNDGRQTNEAVFRAVLADRLGKAATLAIPFFEEYYRAGFHELKALCGFRPQAGPLMATLKARGLRLILASKPIFPRDAQEARMRWAGVDPADFEYITVSENSTFCKPSPAYYTEILRKNGLAPEECRMIGNDTEDDLAAEEVGIRTYLVMDALLNRDGRDISAQPRGEFDGILPFLEK